MAYPGEGNPADTVSFPGMSGEYTGMMAASNAARRSGRTASRRGNKRADVAKLPWLIAPWRSSRKPRPRWGSCATDWTISAGKLDGAQAELAAAQDQVEALTQAEAERRARGLLARLSAALQGE